MKNITTVIMILSIAALLGGCDQKLVWKSSDENSLDNVEVQRTRPIETAADQSAAPKAPAQSDAVHLAHDVVAAQSGEDRTEGAVKEAVGWMTKYTQATEQLMNSEKRCMALQEENRELKAQLAQVQNKIQQYQKELHDANKEILITNDALEKWKTRVLGLQDLNNKAHEAQLQALYQILKILGAETPSNTVTNGKDR